MYTHENKLDVMLELLGIDEATFRDGIKRMCLSKMSIEDLFSEFTTDKKKLKTAVDLWMNDKVTIYKDVIPTLNVLYGKIKMAILSNSSTYIREFLKEKRISAYFDKIYLSAEYGLLKPDPRLFNIILKDFNLKPEEVAMVGDKESKDIAPAKQKGILGILIDRKNSKEKILADYKIQNLREIEKII